MKELLRKIVVPLVMLAIGTTATAQDKLLLLTQSNLGYTAQTWFYSGSGNELQEDQIQTNWDEGRYITSAAHTTKGWFVTMAKNTGLTYQTYHYGKEWPGDWIKQKRNEGCYITTIASNRTKWFIVLSKGTGYTDQCTFGYDDWSENADRIRNLWDEGYCITQATYTGSNWFIVMSLNSGYDRQRYFWGSSFDEIDPKIRKQWDDGYSITLLEFGDGEYFVVSSTFKDNSHDAQTYIINPSQPKEFISRQWNNSQDIAYVGGGYEDSGSQQATPAANNTTSNPGNTINTGNSWRQQLPNGGYCDYTRNADGSYSTLTVIPCTWCHGTKNCTICHGTGGVMGYGGIWYPCTACGGFKICRNCNGQGFTTMVGRIQNGVGIGYDSNGHVHLGAGGGNSESEERSESSTPSRDSGKDYIDVIEYAPNYTGEDNSCYCPICDEIAPRHTHIKKRY